MSTPHLLPATRIVSVISFRSVRPISELLQPVSHPPSCVVFTGVFTRSCLVILPADERLFWGWGKAWAHVLWLADALRLDTIRGTYSSGHKSCQAPSSVSRVSVFNVGGAYQDYQDHGWGSFSELENNEEKNHSSFFIQMLTVYAMLPKLKMLSLMRWRIRNSPFVLWKEPKISRGSLQYCRKDGTLCEEGQAWGQGRVRIQAKEPDYLFQFHCDS